MVLGTAERPLRVAIIGAGPAGFYAAAALFKATDVQVTVDMFDKLPAPFGLVRYGVAPDHVDIKRVELAYHRTAADPRFRFFGNVAFGRDLTHEDLRSHYDHILYAVGAQSDRPLRIPGEELDGSFSATEFVAWYNGHPEYAHRSFDLSHHTAVVVGIGNVAMDAARILAKTPDELAATDIADYALDALRESRVTDIYVLGRRGPVQAKFTTPEIREFGDLADATPIIRAEEMLIDPLSAAGLAEDKCAQRNLEVMEEYASRNETDKRRRVHFRFLVSPVEIYGDERVTGMRLVQNELRKTPSGYLNAHPLDKFETLDCGLVLRSVGYKGLPLPGVPFEAKKGTIPNRHGRVETPVVGERVPGEYVAGWAKRGPSGVVGTNKACAVETVAAMLEDVPQTVPVAAERADPDAIVELLRNRGVRSVSFADWQKIDAIERERGAAQGRPRVKMISADEMFAALDAE